MCLKEALPGRPGQSLSCNCLVAAYGEIFPNPDPALTMDGMLADESSV